MLNHLEVTLIKLAQSDHQFKTIMWRRRVDKVTQHNYLTLTLYTWVLFLADIKKHFPPHSRSLKKWYTFHLQLKQFYPFIQMFVYFKLYIINVIHTKWMSNTNIYLLENTWFFFFSSLLSSEFFNIPYNVWHWEKY